MYTLEYKPTIPAQLIGIAQQQTATRLLESASNGQIIPPQLFCGPSGCGKTTIANMVANSFPDVEIIHYNCGDMTGVGDAREIVAGFDRLPLWGGKRVYIFDEVHSLSNEAQEAFLIPLERALYYNHIVIFAATTSLGKLKETFVSRFVRHQFLAPDTDQMRRLVKSILKHQELELPTDVISDVINLAGGNVRSLVTLLEEVVNGKQLIVTADDIGTTNFIDLLKQQDLAGLLQVEDNYNSLLYRACLYARKVLITNPRTEWATKVLLQFGEVVMAGQVVDKVVYYHLMVRYFNT